MTWYGSQHSSTKQLDLLLQQRPKFSQLLSYGDFLQHLRSYNTKLLDYLSNSPDLPKQLIEYLAVPPSENDSSDRKYKLPLLTIQAIQTQTVCILNAFFRIDPETNSPYLMTLFKRLLSVNEVLPMLAGYFFRVNDCLLKVKLKETVQCLYNKQQPLKMILKHPYNMALVNVLQLYLNLDGNRCAPISQRTQMNVSIINATFDRISQEFRSARGESYRVAIIENLTYALLEVIDKYYLLPDGKAMIDSITSEKNIKLMTEIMLAEKDQSYPVMSFFLTILRYYSCSAYNSEQLQNPDSAKKSLERLQGLPIVNILCSHFNEAMQRILKAKQVNLYRFRLLQVFCHATSLISLKIFEKVKQIKFYQSLIELMFRNQQCNILHMLIERAFLHIFVTEKKIYQLYKKHLFCQMSIIDLTAGRMLTLVSDKGLTEARKHGNFGTFMKILKIYSGIQTFDEDISNAIKSRSQIWSKTSKMLIKPYQTLSAKDLGGYQDIVQTPPVQYTVSKSAQISPQRLINNDNIIDEVNRQQALPTLKTSISSEDKKQETMGNYQQATYNTKIEQDNFFKVPEPAQNSKKQPQTAESPKVQGKNNQSQPQQEKQIKKSQSFKDFLNKQKIEVGKEIKSQRSQSYQKKISSRNTRLMSPSPRKKNSWKQQEQQSNKATVNSKSVNQSMDGGPKSLKLPRSNLPKVPISPKVSGRSLVYDSSYGNDDRKMAKSLVDLGQLKNIRVQRISNQPSVRKDFRKVSEKDNLLLEYLGIRTAKTERT